MNTAEQTLSQKLNLSDREISNLLEPKTVTRHEGCGFVTIARGGRLELYKIEDGYLEIFVGYLDPK
jgi:hypothetical protein